MKYLICLLIFPLSINCYGETNRQILEDIRDEIEFMQYERELRSTYGDNKQVRPQPQPNQSWLQIMGYSKIIWQSPKSTIYVKDASISRIGNSDQFLISYLIRFNKPQYAGDKTFFMIHVLSESIFCKSSRMGMGVYQGLDNEYKAVANLGRSPIEKISPNSIGEDLKKYVCP